MHILIDRRRMVVVYKHHSPSTLSQLCEMELTESAAMLLPLEDARGIDILTDHELQLLYHNTTGVKLPGFLREQSVGMVYDAMLRIPESKLNPSEVELQYSKLPTGDDYQYLYCPGSICAREARDIYEHPALTCAPSDPGARAPQRVATDWSVSDEPVENHTAVQGSVNAPKTGSVSSTIWEVMDQLWHDAGSPQDATVVLKLRKTAMQKLETEFLIKRTTSSTTLGGWQKIRLKPL